MSLPSAVDWVEAHWTLEDGSRPVLTLMQRAALDAMFPPDGTPSAHETFLISAPKKQAKTETNAMAVVYAALTLPAPVQLYCVANDEAQATERVFDRAARVLRAMGLEAEGAVRITATVIEFTETGTRIEAIPADFAGAAGAVFSVTSWTELWAFRHESHVRLFEEMTPNPQLRSLRIVDSYAGFAGDSPVLEPMWNRALAGTRLDDTLPIFTNGRLWAWIDTGEEAQARGWIGRPEDRESYYAEQRATLRPGTYARLHLNTWQSSEEAFITADRWDALVVPDLLPLPATQRGAPDAAPPARLAVGVDLATKSDCAAVVAVARDGERVRLARHRIWTPRKGQPLDIEATVEVFILELARDFHLDAVFFDPYQMARSAATLARRGVPMVEFPQTSGNLTAASQNLWELISERRLLVYPDRTLREHALNAVAVESGRGWRLAKEKSSRKIDGAVALSFACLAALRELGRPSGMTVEQTAPAFETPVVRRGDLVLRGERYLDRDEDLDRRAPPPGWMLVT